ncbi:hypothetical protein [Bosea sp. (in: a-proteobacteria)]|uniref:hypothetical protein n=1 Tax=Bosea sp. (in: a-proteobacteria) TaxID=1871050 RepID=UPI0027339CD1|nr:hypothetical protein [Bosea sp. (in: a-proteobacteria)]MDP3256765.1 hypothetical protein [Bosea sp. (in: a-proteobacteria)]
MRNETVVEIAGRRVVLMDSISLIAPQDEGSIIICGSHGGLISGAFAALHPPHLVVFNDAGGGKAGAGRACIAMLDAKGIACATTSHSTARIGDAQDAWLSGVLSAVGNAARQKGLEAGQSVKDAVDAASGQ